MEFTHTSLSEAMKHDRGQPVTKMSLRNLLLVYHRHMSEEKEGERIYHRSNENPKRNRNQWNSKCSNDLLKHDDRLNVNAASYSTHPQSLHILLVFADDSPTYEMLFESPTLLRTILNLPNSTLGRQDR